jgi:YbbR domain-containing protein
MLNDSDYGEQGTMEKKTIEKSGISKIKAIMFNNILLKMGSVLFAIVLWIVVINVDDPLKTVTVYNIPVEIQNDSVFLDNNMVYKVSSGEKISVRITGPRTIVDSLKADDFYATADFFEVSKTNAVPIDVKLRKESYETKVVINEQSSNAMRLNVEKVVELEYEITPEWTGSVLDNYVLYNCSLATKKVKVKAPESVHQSIAGVKAFVELTGNENEDFEYNSEIHIYDTKGKAMDLKDNDITMDTSFVKAKCTVYYKKTLPVKYDFTNGIGNESEITIAESSPENVTVVGRKTNLDGLNEIRIPTVFDVTRDKTEFNVKIKDILKDGVYLLDDTEEFKVKFSYLNNITKDFTVKVSEIAIKNIPTDHEASIINTGNVTLTISGLEDVVNNTELEDISPFLSLENLKEGMNNISVQIVKPDGITLKSNVILTINLTSKTEVETTSVMETTTVAETTVANPSQEVTTKPNN